MANNPVPAPRTDLSGKVALVTGSSRGLGAGIARRLGAAGADVAVTYRKNADAAAAVAATIRAGGSRCEVFELDTSAPPKPGEEAPASRAWMNKAPSANTLLDEFFEEAPKSDGFSAEELKRVEAALENQKKTTAILTALQSLLAEKGYTR